MSQQRDSGNLVLNGPASRPDVLASDADRDAVAGMLSSAYAEGRLSAAEHAERASAAYAARTGRELGSLVSDLPGHAGALLETRMTAMPDDVDRCIVDRCMLCALLILCPPAGIAWLLAARRRSRLAVEPPPLGSATCSRSA